MPVLFVLFCFPSQNTDLFDISWKKAYMFRSLNFTATLSILYSNKSRLEHTIVDPILQKTYNLPISE